MTEVSRADPRSPLLYVDYLAVAPWNDGQFRRAARMDPERPELQALGPLLVDLAVALSRTAGYEGRIGLHSEANATGWYRDKVGLRDFGLERDGDKEWLYFEGDPVWATAWVGRAP
jgi:hypothetical protein